MNIYIYSDESGVFDYANNDYFVFGGLICFGNNDKNDTIHKFAHVENTLRETGRYPSYMELKASNISNSDKGKLFRSLNHSFKFCVLVKQTELHKEIFNNKKHKQRYLDYAYKIVLKKCFETLIKRSCLKADAVEYIYVNCDEHITATDGKYELRENLLNEFKFGTFNFDWDHLYEPIFPMLKDVCVSFCDSKKNRLVRAADLIANHFWHSAIQNHGIIEAKSNTFIYALPDKVISSNGLDFFINKSKKEKF